MEAQIIDSVKFSLGFGVALFSILNPMGALPVFLGLTKSCPEKEISKISSSCAWAIFFTLLVSLFFGQGVLQFFGISLAAFRVGGGILISTMALGMLSAKNQSTKLNRSEIMDEENRQSIGVVPLAIPLLSGPGTISTAILYSQEISTFSYWAGTILMVCLICLTIKLILSMGRKIASRIGQTGLNVMTRVMGLIIMAVAVETISTGLKQLFPVLGQLNL